MGAGQHRAFRRLRRTRDSSSSATPPIPPRRQPCRKLIIVCGRQGIMGRQLFLQVASRSGRRGPQTLASSSAPPIPKAHWLKCAAVAPKAWLLAYPVSAHKEGTWRTALSAGLRSRRSWVCPCCRHPQHYPGARTPAVPPHELSAVASMRAQAYGTPIEERNGTRSLPLSRIPFTGI